MKKILIVNNNMDIGGIQKSLVNLLKEIHDKYEVTLLLFSATGALLKDVPKSVKIITPHGKYRMLGLSKEELKKFPALFVAKAFLMKYAELFSRRSAMKLLGLFQQKIRGYDAVISYTHLSAPQYFWNGCGDFVLDKTICRNKICIIHCDYLNSGCISEKNNAEYNEFNKIACCSASVKDRFMQGASINPEKVHVLYNCLDLSVAKAAAQQPYCYSEACINIVTVARLSVEKGIDRAIEAVHKSKRTDIRYHIIGEGPQKKILVDMVDRYGLGNTVFFEGEQENPYRYMCNADFLLLPSLHEAAPMVFGEAKIMGLPVITTNTTSAKEMIGDKYGIICDNSTEGIESALRTITKPAKKNQIEQDNKISIKQFSALLQEI